jgi:hypothetical protein
MIAKVDQQDHQPGGSSLAKRVKLRFSAILTTWCQSLPDESPITVEDGSRINRLEPVNRIGLQRRIRR